MNVDLSGRFVQVNGATILFPLDLSVSLYRALPNAELAVCPWLSHDGPAPERAPILASLIRDFARRHAER